MGGGFQRLDRKDPGGGSVALAEVIESHGTELAVDFRVYYGLALSSVVGGEVSPAEGIALINALPEGSRYMAAHLGGEDAEVYLGVDRHYRVLADIYDAVTNNTLATGNWRKGKAPKLEPYPVPEVLLKERQQERKRKNRTIRDLHRIFSRGH